MRTCKVAVIGAGAAGLVTARELQREGHSVTVFEQAPRAGGIWVYSDEIDSDPLGVETDRKRVHGSLYSGLRTNLPRQVMSYSDFPFSPSAMGKFSIDSRLYPCHEEVLRYLDAFMDKYQLGELVRYNRQVIRVAPIATDGASAADATLGQLRWVVETRTTPLPDSSAPGEVEKEVFDAVMIANGHFSEPHLPKLAGADVFPGVQLHSHNYRRPEHYAGQTVAIVGSSFSALDISKHVSTTADRVYICAREWKTEHALGSPYGPRSNIERRGVITRLTDEGGAEFAVGQAAPKVDAVIYCTGFEYYFPFLDLHSLGLSTSQQHVAPLYQHVFTPTYGPGLAFIGLPFRAAAFPMFELQAKLCARLLSGRSSLPPAEEMSDWIERTKQQLAAEGLPPQATHRFDHRQLAHHAWLAKACGPDVSAMPNWRSVLMHVYWVSYWLMFQAGQWGRYIRQISSKKEA